MSRFTALAVVRCVFRNLPLLVAASPRTPLRVLCITALDTVHVLRHARPIPAGRIREVAEFIDFQGCTNAMWDRKPCCEEKYSAMRWRLEAVGLGLYVADYVRGVHELESRRPQIRGAVRNFDDVRAYREGVARVSLAAVAAVAFGTSLEHELGAIDVDCHMNTLFRIVMQCQVVDDILDYRHDLEADLPSFMTAASSRDQSMALTAAAAGSYFTPAAVRQAAWPFRWAISAVSMVTFAIVRLTGMLETESQDLSQRMTSSVPGSSSHP